jgi:hypothetical protein
MAPRSLAVQFQQHVDRTALAREAIEKGRTMGQLLRDLPESHKMTPAELQEYGRAYALARRGGGAARQPLTVDEVLEGRRS